MRRRLLAAGLTLLLLPLIGWQLDGLFSPPPEPGNGGCVDQHLTITIDAFTEGWPGIDVYGAWICDKYLDLTVAPSGTASN